MQSETKFSLRQIQSETKFSLRQIAVQDKIQCEKKNFQPSEKSSQTKFCLGLHFVSD